MLGRALGLNCEQNPSLEAVIAPIGGGGDRRDGCAVKERIRVR
jgi:hypothetical protein